MNFDNIFLKYIVNKFYNISLFSYIYLIFVAYVIGYLLTSFSFPVDLGFKLCFLFVAYLYMVYVHMNLKSIIVDYINNEVSQVLLISLSLIFIVNVIVYICILV